MVLIKIQSWSDIITNSSSEIFCVAQNTKLLKDFITSILELSGSDVKLDDLIKIEIIPDLNRIRDAVIDQDDWMIDLLNEYEIDIDHFNNALTLSSEINFLPIDTYLKQYNVNFITICNKVRDIMEGWDSILESNYVIMPVNDNVDMELIGRINSMLGRFANGLYDIQERYN